MSKRRPPSPSGRKKATSSVDDPSIPIEFLPAALPPLWSDEDIRAEAAKWDTQAPYEDPEGHPPLISPIQEQVAQWIRPSQIAEFQNCVIRSSTIREEESTLDYAERKYFLSKSMFSEAHQAAGPWSFLISIFLALARLRQQSSSEPSEPMLWEMIAPRDAQGHPAVSASGKYAVRLHLGGEWRRVMVDDRLPCDAAGHCLLPWTRATVPLAASSEGAPPLLPAELWAPLLVKALCKISAGSRVLYEPHPCVAAWLTGWIPQSLRYAPHALTQSEFLHRLGATQCLAVFPCSEERAPPETAGADLAAGSDSLSATGLIGGHMHTIAETRTYEGELLLRVQSPWSRWHGRFSDSDAASWTPDAENALDQTHYERTHEEIPSDFWIPFAEFQTHFREAHAFVSPRIYAHRAVWEDWWDASPGKAQARAPKESPLLYIEDADADTELLVTFEPAIEAVPLEHAVEARASIATFDWKSTASLTLGELACHRIDSRAIVIPARHRLLELRLNSPRGHRVVISASTPIEVGPPVAFLQKRCGVTVLPVKLSYPPLAPLTRQLLARRLLHPALPMTCCIFPLAPDAALAPHLRVSVTPLVAASPAPAPSPPSRSSSPARRPSPSVCTRAALSRPPLPAEESSDGIVIGSAEWMIGRCVVELAPSAAGYCLTIDACPTTPVAAGALTLALVLDAAPGADLALPPSPASPNPPSRSTSPARHGHGHHAQPASPSTQLLAIADEPGRAVESEGALPSPQPPLSCEERLFRSVVRPKGSSPCYFHLWTPGAELPLVLRFYCAGRLVAQQVGRGAVTLPAVHIAAAEKGGEKEARYVIEALADLRWGATTSPRPSTPLSPPATNTRPRSGRRPPSAKSVRPPTAGRTRGSGSRGDPKARGAPARPPSPSGTQSGDMAGWRLRIVCSVPVELKDDTSHADRIATLKAQWDPSGGKSGRAAKAGKAREDYLASIDGTPVVGPTPAKPGTRAKGDERDPRESTTPGTPYVLIPRVSWQDASVSPDITESSAPDPFDPTALSSLQSSRLQITNSLRVEWEAVHQARQAKRTALAAAMSPSSPSEEAEMNE